ncbi:MAG TPA: tetratricopeptide repeat protein [Myxococcales bacterium]|nr:tetratricopeptide repeat protein [Myxococcales bacterium]
MILLIALLAATSTPASLEKSCKAGKAAACDELGGRYSEGLGVRRDETRAAELFRRSCKAGNQDGCADDARALALGAGQTADAKAALVRLDKLCKEGKPRACGHLGEVLLRGLGGPQSGPIADDLLAKACDEGFGRACSNLASAVYKAAPQREQAEALSLRGCNLGDPAGCVFVGELYGSSGDALRAGVYLARACDAGLARGCGAQGFLLVDSGADPKRGEKLLQKGCDGGDPRSCDALRDLKLRDVKK